MNLQYSNHIVTVQSIARLPLPRPFALASAFGFATAPVFHAAAVAAPTISLSLALSRTIDRSFASISDPQESAMVVLDCSGLP
jgi:hypothetical protein